MEYEQPILRIGRWGQLRTGGARRQSPGPTACYGETFLFSPFNALKRFR